MPTLLQLATLFNVFGSMLVLGLSALTLRYQPLPYFRYWVYAYGAATLVTCANVAESVMGRSLPIFLYIMAMLVPTLGFLIRLVYELRGRRFPALPVALALASMVVLGLALWLGGAGYEAAMVPAVLGIMATHLWLGITMIRVGRTADYEGMGWIGVPVLIHGLWVLTFPLFAATNVLWLGFSLEAMLEIGVGVGMAMYVLFRTSRRLAQQNLSLQAADHALREAQEVQREFLNAVSHELRTPLTSVVGYADFLAEQVGGPINDRQAEYVTRIRRGAGRMSRLVDDMLDYAGIEAGEFALAPEAIDVRAIVRGEVENLEPQSRERQVQVVLEMPPEPVVAWADPLRVGQVITNLLGNAVKFSPAGGTVRVSASAAGPEVRIELRDEGVGIAAEHLPHLFRKFYRVDTGASRDRGGTGLGLTISRALVEAQGGRIGASSEPGVGSLFWFSLPASLVDRTT